MAVVRLEGGPAAGIEVDVSRGAVLNVEGEGVPDGLVARYTPTRDRGVYRFRGYSKVIARLPMPGAAP